MSDKSVEEGCLSVGHHNAKIKSTTFTYHILHTKMIREALDKLRVNFKEKVQILVSA